jgi:hypothetical protein
MMMSEDMERHPKSFLISIQMEVTGQLHAVAALPSLMLSQIPTA